MNNNHWTTRGLRYVQRTTLVSTATVALLLTLQANAQPVTHDTVTQWFEQQRYHQVSQTLLRMPPGQRSVEQTLQLATSLFYQQQYQSASTVLDELDNTAQQDTPALMLRVDIEIALQNWQTARSRLTAARQFAQQPGYLLRMGQVLLALGETDLADDYFAQYQQTTQTQAGAQ